MGSPADRVAELRALLDLAEEHPGTWDGSQAAEAWAESGQEWARELLREIDRLRAELASSTVADDYHETLALERDAALALAEPSDEEADRLWRAVRGASPPTFFGGDLADAQAAWDRWMLRNILAHLGQRAGVTDAG